MKVTPLEIRQKTFAKKVRGYDKDEVNAYLQSLSQEWERLNAENKELKVKLTAAEKDVERLRDVEASLFKTLKAAEDTGANMIDQANKSAALQVKEAQMQADALLNDARSQARDMIEEAEEEVRSQLDSTQDQLRSLQNDCKTIESYRDDLLHELQTIANDTLQRAEKLEKKRIQFPPLKSSQQRETGNSYKASYAAAPKIEEVKEPKVVDTPAETVEEEKPGPVVKEEVKIPEEPQNTPKEIKPKEEPAEQKPAEEPREYTFEVVKNADSGSPDPDPEPEESETSEDAQEDEKKKSSEDGSFFDNI